MSLKTLKVEKDLCRCCHAEGKFQKLSEPYTHLGRLEDYSEMMRTCLDVDVSNYIYFPVHFVYIQFFRWSTILLLLFFIHLFLFKKRV